MTTRRTNGKGRTHQAAPAKRAVASRPTKAAARASRAPKPTAQKVATFAADCTIAQAAVMKSQLAKVIDAKSSVTLDVTCVRRIDTAGFQVLASFIRERRAAGRGVQCAGASESFSVTASLLGLGALFSPVTDDRLPAPAARA